MSTHNMFLSRIKENYHCSLILPTTGVRRHIDQFGNPKDREHWARLIHLLIIEKLETSNIGQGVLGPAYPFIDYWEAGNQQV